MVQWKHVFPLKDSNAINKLEKKYCYQLPQDLKDCIEKNNAGMPVPYQFDIDGRKELVFGGLCSFNEGDVDCIYDFIDGFVDNEGKLKLFPFGLDPFGNFFCVQDGKIVLWEHEFEDIVVIADSFTRFLNMLHE